jgi:hypothetical protein
MAEPATEVSQGVDKKSGWELFLSKLKREKAPPVKTENELRLEAFGKYQEILLASKDNSVKVIGESLKGAVESLSYKFRDAKEKNPTLTAEQFVSQSSNGGGSHMEFAGSGWNNKDHYLNEWYERPIEKDSKWGVITTGGISDILGESGYVNIDERFSKVSDPSQVDRVSYTVKYGSGSYNELGAFSQWWTSVKSPEMSKAGIAVGLKREDASPVGPHEYFTGQVGGIRGFIVDVDKHTIAAAIEKTEASFFKP